jgi:hypothetical protein
MCDDVQLCNHCVHEFLILVCTWFTFGLPSKTGCDITRDHRCAHLVPSVTPIEPRASCGTVATRTSGALPQGPRDTATWQHRGPAVARPLDRGAAATALPTLEPPPLLGSRNRSHRASGLGSRGHRLGLRYRARSRATATIARAWVGAIANESRWGMKN